MNYGYYNLQLCSYMLKAKIQGGCKVLIGVEAVENPYFRCWDMLKTVKKILRGVGCQHPQHLVNM